MNWRPLSLWFWMLKMPFFFFSLLFSPSLMLDVRRWHLVGCKNSIVTERLQQKKFTLIFQFAIRMLVQNPARNYYENIKITDPPTNYENYGHDYFTLDDTTVLRLFAFQPVDSLLVLFDFNLSTLFTLYHSKLVYFSFKLWPQLALFGSRGRKFVDISYTVCHFSICNTQSYLPWPNCGIDSEVKEPSVFWHDFYLKPGTSSPDFNLVALILMIHWHIFPLQTQNNLSLLRILTLPCTANMPCTTHGKKY